MTITELIALLSKAPRNTKWYVENRTVTSVNFEHRNELSGINFTFGVGFQLTFVEDGYEQAYALSSAAYAVLDDGYTIIIKDANEVFYALTAQEVKDFNLSNLTSDKSSDFAMPPR